MTVRPLKSQIKEAKAGAIQPLPKGMGTQETYGPIRPSVEDMSKTRRLREIEPRRSAEVSSLRATRSESG